MTTARVGGHTRVGSLERGSSEVFYWEFVCFAQATHIPQERNLDVSTLVRSKSVLVFYYWQSISSYLIANRTITFLYKPSISIGSYSPNIPEYSQPFEIGTLLFQPFYWSIIIHLLPT